MSANNHPRLGSWLRRFLEEHLPSERNLTVNTQLSYRDTFCLLLSFVSSVQHTAVDNLKLRDLDAACIREFLKHLEQVRGSAPQTCNQRLAAVQCFARFVASHCPEQVEWCEQIRAIHHRKAAPPMMTYLEKVEMDALLDAPNGSTAQGRRDRTLLLFLYNTGARVSEVAQLIVADLKLEKTETPLVTLRGKGGKTRRCPLWQHTAAALTELVTGVSVTAPVFRSRNRRALTRSGIAQLVGRHARSAALRVPSMQSKTVTPHVLRHTAATHLLRSGVDINTIRAWLGHSKIDTTIIYAEIDLEAKARAITGHDPGEQPRNRPWKEDDGLMKFLNNLGNVSNMHVNL